MGLHIQSLENFIPHEKRGYYIYLLDYGWVEPLGEALMKNYEKMAAIAADHNAVVVRGTDRKHFEDQVLSWHHINGEDAKEILPAILITNADPHSFKESHSSKGKNTIREDLKLVLIPLRKFCSTTQQVVDLVERLFNDIKAKKDLSEFRIGKKIKKGHQALADSVILEPAKDKKPITMDEVIDFLKDLPSDKSPSTLKVNKTVHPIHFEDMSGQQFERLIFAFVARQKRWDTIQWLGETGGDGGRDIWGAINKETFCYQCANYKQLVLKKITDDIDKLVKAGTIPQYYIAVCGNSISAAMRGKISAYATKVGISNTEVWSGAEVEEKLRQHSPDLLKRFVDGETFPEDSVQLIKATDEPVALSDPDIIELFSQCFDRPAFTTAFHRESNVPDFEKAITDTIEVLNTGVYRLRDGTIIKRIPSRHQLKDPELKDAFAEIAKLVVKLRDTFSQLKKDKEIRPCGCSDDNCSVWMLSDKACEEMDNIREQIFRQFRLIYPGFKLKLH